jgi:hypothetical protein
LFFFGGEKGGRENSNETAEEHRGAGRRGEGEELFFCYFLKGFLGATITRKCTSRANDMDRARLVKVNPSV